MDREIKFRAYSKITKHYFDITHVENGSETISKKSILEQFTGLKDKNGADIYEGDIVRKVIELDGGVINNWIVFYGEGGFDIKRVKENGEQTTMYLKNYWKHTYEVIGNIHENPDLL